MSTEPRPRPRSRAGRWALGAAEVALFLALPFLVLWRYAPGLSPLTLGNDYVLFPFDAQLEIVWAWRHGLVPHYVPGFAGGHSVAALTLGQAWHPLTWIAALVPGHGSGKAELIVTTLRLLELGLTHLAIHRASRATGLAWAPSFVLTTAVVFNARMLDSFRYGASLEGFCGMLLACAAFAGGWRAGWTARRVAMAAGAVYLTLVSGHPQWALFGTLGAAVFGLLVCLPSRQLLPAIEERRLRHVAAVALAGGIGALLAAGYLAPFVLEFLRENASRVAQGHAFTLAYGDSVAGTMASFVRPFEADVHGAFGGTAIPLVLFAAVPVVLVTWTRPPLVVLAPAAVAALTLAFAVGGATPVHGWVVAHVPLFSSFRVPGRITLLLPPLWLLVGWIVLADLGRAELRRPWARVPALVPASALALLATLVHQLARPSLTPSGHAPFVILDVAWWAPAAVAALGGASLAGLLFTTGPRATRRAGWLVAAVATLGVASVTLTFSTWTTPRKDTRTMARLDAHHRKHLAFTGDEGFGMEARIVADAEAAGVALKRPPGWIEGDAGPVPVKPRGVHWNAWRFEVDVPDGGIFVFGQPHLRGWRATVDGAPAPLGTHEGVFPSLALGPGRHQVELRFVSVPGLAGGAIAFLTLAAAAVVWITRDVPRGRARVAAVIVALGATTAAAAAWNAARSPDLDVLSLSPRGARPPADR